MILFDFIMRQNDRHLFNVAIRISGAKEFFYPLYDNGRRLFYEDIEEMAKQAVIDPKAYTTTFGYSETYWDYVRKVATGRGNLKGLLNLNISETEVLRF